MGHTVFQWREKVGQLVRDEAGVDLNEFTLDSVGLAPAFARYSDDRPRVVIEEQAGTGSAYLDLPASWQADFSVLQRVEYPARQNPPTFLAPVEWTITQAVDDVDETAILLYDWAPGASEHVRIAYTAMWPFPTEATSPVVDLLGDIAFEAVASLAAAYCCDSLAGEAARDRSAALPSDFVSGGDRADNLRLAADRYRANYERFIERTGALSSRMRVGTVAVSRRLL